MMVSGHPAKPHGINTVGLRRRGFSDKRVATIKRAYRLLYRSGLPLAEAREKIAAEAGASEEMRVFAEFLAAGTRSIVR
jgi:UDP-N-acetylglucosamine acyltransferase